MRKASGYCGEGGIIRILEFVGMSPLCRVSCCIVIVDRNWIGLRDICRGGGIVMSSYLLPITAVPNQGHFPEPEEDC